MPIPDAGKAPLYSGAVDCVIKTVKLEGIRGLYKGNVYQSRSYQPSKILFSIRYSLTCFLTPLWYLYTRYGGSYHRGCTHICIKFCGVRIWKKAATNAPRPGIEFTTACRCWSDFRSTNNLNNGPWRENQVHITGTRFGFESFQIQI